MKGPDQTGSDDASHRKLLLTLSAATVQHEYCSRAVSQSTPYMTLQVSCHITLTLLSRCLLPLLVLTVTHDSYHVVLINVLIIPMPETQEITDRKHCLSQETREVSLRPATVSHAGNSVHSQRYCQGPRQIPSTSWWTHLAASVDIDHQLSAASSLQNRSLLTQLPSLGSGKSLRYNFHSKPPPR